MSKKSPNPIDVHVGSRVRLRRMMLGMSQEKLGEHLGITFQQIQKYEKGTNRIGASRMQAIARVLSVPVAFFFEDAPGQAPIAGEQCFDRAATNPIVDFLSTSEGLSLNRAFLRIKNAKRPHRGGSLIMASPAQIGLIHGLKKRAALDDEAYRDVLRSTAGVASARDLSGAAAGRVIGRLKVLAGDDPAKARPARPKAAGALALEGPFVGKLRALWLTAWNLGLVGDRSDRALASFVGRQTGIDSPSWVRDPKDAARAIEGLKAWIAREAKLAWPKDPRDIHQIKWSLVRRQWEILIDAGREIRLTKWADLAEYAAEMIRRDDRLPRPPAVSMTLAELTDEQLDRLAAALGAKIRKAKGGAS